MGLYERWPLYRLLQNQILQSAGTCFPIFSLVAVFQKYDQISTWSFGEDCVSLWQFSLQEHVIYADVFFPGIIILLARSRSLFWQIKIFSF